MPEGRGRDETASALHSVAIHLLRLARREDRSFGLSAARLSVLSVLVFGGPERLGTLAELEQVKPPTMTRMVQAMERDGLVKVEIAREDRRVRRVQATARGRRLLEAARRARIENLAAVVEALDERERKQVRRAASTLEKALLEVRKNLVSGSAS